MNKNAKMITSEKEGLVLARLTGHMTMGILGIIIFNLVDTLYVGRLGMVELAALSFTFPIVLMINSVAHGLAGGMISAVSKATGEENREKQKHLITWGMALSFMIAIVAVIAGQMTITPVFTLLGADAETMVFIKQYMSIWYWGVMFVVIPIVGNAAIRGMGDTKTPSRVMMISAIMNTILDPMLIFGIGPFPELGVAGAALSTVLSRATTFTVAWYILIFRERVISFRNTAWSVILKTWSEILYVGVPNIFSKMIVPLATGVITGMIATFGREAVAGFGIASRINMFALIMINSMVAIIPIFVGQNLGARQIQRVERGLKLANVFSLVYSIVIYLILMLSARPLVRLINGNPKVVEIAVLYLRIVPLSYGFTGILLTAVNTLYVLKKPLHSALLTLFHMFAVYIPLAMYGSKVFGVVGIFSALALSYCIAAPLGRWISKSKLNNWSMEVIPD